MPTPSTHVLVWRTTRANAYQNDTFHVPISHTCGLIRTSTSTSHRVEERWLIDSAFTQQFSGTTDHPEWFRLPTSAPGTVHRQRSSATGDHRVTRSRTWHIALCSWTSGPPRACRSTVARHRTHW